MTGNRQKHDLDKTKSRCTVKTFIVDRIPEVVIVKKYRFRPDIYLIS